MREPHIETGRGLVNGTAVWTADDERVGTVAQVVGDYVRVDDSDGRQRWFELDELQSVNEERAILAFGADDVAAREVRPPVGGVDPGDRPRAKVLPDEEEQRETMLRELAEQRERMHAEGRATPEADRTVGEPVEEELSEMESDDNGPPPPDAREARR